MVAIEAPTPPNLKHRRTGVASRRLGGLRGRGAVIVIVGRWTRRMARLGMHLGGVRWSLSQSTMHICASIPDQVDTHTHAHMCLCMFGDVQTCVCAHACINGCMYVCTSVCIYIHIFVYMQVSEYVGISVYSPIGLATWIYT